jgi:hypothetical protein
MTQETSTKKEPKSGRHIAKKELLEKTRTRVWFAAVCEQAGIDPPSATELGKWTAKHDTSDGKLGDIEWKRYEQGISSVSRLTLELVERALPGTTAVYEEGPFELPLWAVLNGDLAACQKYVNGLMPKERGVLTLSFKDKVEQLFEWLIAPAYRQDFATLAQNRNRQFDPIWLSYVNGKHAHLDEKTDDPSDNLLDQGFLPELVVGVIALWQIALSRDEGFVLEMEYLVNGLCQGIIAQEFNSIPLQDYVLSLLQEKARGIDKDFAKRDVDVPEFGKRSEIAINVKNK